MGEEEGDADDSVGPDVPGSEEAQGVSERAAGPGVEATFEGKFAVDVEDGDGHGGVKGCEGEEPDERLRVAEACGESDPGATDDSKDLREDEVAEGELAREVVVVGSVER